MAFALDPLLQIELTGGTAVAADEHSGHTHVWHHALGNGRIIATVALPEDAMIAVSGQRELRDRWVHWFRGMLDLLK